MVDISVQAVELSWVAEGGDEGTVKGRSCHSTTTVYSSKVLSRASETVVPRLVLGQSYTARLRRAGQEDVGEGVTFHFMACEDILNVL